MMKDVSSSRHPVGEGGTYLTVTMIGILYFYCVSAKRNRAPIVRCSHCIFTSDKGSSGSATACDVCLSAKLLKNVCMNSDDIACRLVSPLATSCGYASASIAAAVTGLDNPVRSPFQHICLRRLQLYNISYQKLVAIT